MTFKEWLKQNEKYLTETDLIPWIKEAFEAGQKSLKPSWGDAPDNAEYLAMDFDGRWFWYKEAPVINEHHFCWNGDDLSDAYCESEYWKSTLEKRP